MPLVRDAEVGVTWFPERPAVYYRVSKRPARTKVDEDQGAGTVVGFAHYDVVLADVVVSEAEGIWGRVLGLQSA